MVECNERGKSNLCGHHLVPIPCPGTFLKEKSYPYAPLQSCAVGLQKLNCTQLRLGIYTCNMQIASEVIDCVKPENKQIHTSLIIG